LKTEQEIRAQLEKDMKIVNSNPASPYWVSALWWVLDEFQAVKK
jgi:hypothetical protein